MTRQITIAIVFVMLFCGVSSVSAQTDPVPDVNGWNVVNMSRIELRVSDCAGVYLGFETEYNNPANPKDFVRIIRRHVPVPIAKCVKYNDRLLRESVTALYNQKEEQDLLSRRSSESDPFLYVQWQIDKDPQTGKDVVVGDITLGIMPADGNWTVLKNDKVIIEFMTENVGNGTPRNIFSGVEIRIAGFSHIVRADRDNVIQLVEGGK